MKSAKLERALRFHRQHTRMYCLARADATPRDFRLHVSEVEIAPNTRGWLKYEEVLSENDTIQGDDFGPPPLVDLDKRTSIVASCFV